MAQTKRKPAAEKPAAQTDTPTNNPEEAGLAADSAAVQPDANPIPQEAAMPPEGAAPPADASQEAEPPEPTIDGDLVRVRTVGKAPRRRAGRAFGPDQVEIAMDELSEDDLAALQGDPMLVVELVESAA